MLPVVTHIQMAWYKVTRIVCLWLHWVEMQQVSGDGRHQLPVQSGAAPSREYSS